MIKPTYDIIAEALEPTCGDRVFRAGSVLADAVPTSPFAVVRFGVVQRGMGAVKQLSVEIWVHNSTADYGPIDTALSAVSGMLDGAAHVRESGEEGSAELILAEWRSTSGDLSDPGFRTVTKNASYQLTGTGV